MKRNLITNRNSITNRHLIAKSHIITTIIALALSATLTGCGSSKTIVDEVSYSTDGSMIDEAKKYMDSNDVMYEEKSGVHNTVSDKFLGYRAYYDIDADDFYIYLTFDSDDDLNKASKDVKKYFESKKSSDYEDSELCKKMDKSTSGWSQVFDGFNGNIFVIEYKENKDDTINYEAALVCTMNNLDEAKSYTGYIQGELNTYIAISIKGGEDLSIDQILNNEGSSSGVTAAPAATTDSAAPDSDWDSPSVDSATTDSAKAETAAASNEAGDIGNTISVLEKIDEEANPDYGSSSVSETNKENLTITYTKLPTKKGILLFKVYIDSPASYKYLMYYDENGDATVMEVGGNYSTFVYCEDREILVSNDSDMDNNYTSEYGVFDGKVAELAKNSNPLSDYNYNGESVSSIYGYYDTIEEAVLH